MRYIVLATYPYHGRCLPRLRRFVIVRLNTRCINVRACFIPLYKDHTNTTCSFPPLSCRLIFIRYHPGLQSSEQLCLLIRATLPSSAFQNYRKPSQPSSHGFELIAYTDKIAANLLSLAKEFVRGRDRFLGCLLGRLNGLLASMMSTMMVMVTFNRNTAYKMENKRMEALTEQMLTLSLTYTTFQIAGTCTRG